MKQNNIGSLDEAILSGVLGFSVVFLSMKDLFNQQNQNFFIVLIFVYLIASITRMFAVILDSKTIDNLGIFYCRLFLIPYTIWSVTAIFFTEIGLSDFGSPIALYFAFIAYYQIFTKCYGITVKFQSPIKIVSDKIKLDKRS